MSSNLKTKNLIYSFNKHNELPYGTVQTIDYNNGSQYVNMTQLNNTYGQCIDNDMFIVKSMVNQLNGTSYVGPKLLTNDVDIAALPDGAKFFDSAGSSNIMRKHVKTLSQTLKRRNDSNFIDVKFIHKISTQVALVCTSRKTFTIAVDDIHSNGQIDDSLEVKTDDGQSFVVTAVFWYGKHSTTMFAGHPSNTSDNGIYFLDMQGYARNEYAFKLLYRLQSSSNEICAMSSDEHSSKVVFATYNAVYVCDMSKNKVSNVKSIAAFTSSTGNVCALIAFSSSATAFTSTGEIYKINYAAQYYGLVNAYSSPISQNDIIVHESYFANGVQYLATSAGLCIMKDGKIYQINENYASDVKHITVDDDGIVWCGDSDGRILMSTSSTNLEQYSQISNVQITDVKIVNGVKIIVTSNNGLMFERRHKTFYPILGFENVNSARLMTGFSNNANDAYVIGSRNSSSVSIMNAQFSIGEIDPEYSYSFDYIEGLAEISSFSNGKYDVDIVKLAQINGIEYVFVNFIGKDASTISYCAMFNTSTYKNELNGYTKINGVIQCSKNEAYIFMSSGIAIRMLQDNTKSLINPFGNKTIVDSQVVDGRIFFVTLSSDAGYELAEVKFGEESIEVIDTKSIGTSSNVIKHADNYLAFVNDNGVDRLSSFNISYLMNEQDLSANSSFPSNFNTATKAQFELYSSNEFTLVNNMSYRIEDTLMYRRSDYVVPHGSSNIIALQSFIQIDKDNEDEIEMQCISAYEISDTNDVSYVDNAYDSSNGYTATGYISNDNAIYTFQVDNASSKIFNPVSPFIDERKIIASDVELLQIEKVSISKESNSYVAQLTAYEIGVDGQLSAIECTQTENDMTSACCQAENLNSSTPLMMSRCKDQVYVLLQTASNEYSVKKAEFNGEACQLVDIGLNGIESNVSPCSFVFEYKTDNGELTSYLEDQANHIKTIDSQITAFNEFVEQIDESKYVTDCEVVATTLGATMNIMFDSFKYTADFDSNGSLAGTLQKIEWLSIGIDGVIASNQTDSSIENALLVYNAFGSIYEMPLLFKSSDNSPVYSLSEQKMIYGTSVPSSIENANIIGKDYGLGYSWIAKNDSLSVFAPNGNVEYITPIYDDAQDINIIQCCDKKFSQLKCLCYRRYNSSNGMYELKIETSDSSIGPFMLYRSPTKYKVNVLNIWNDLNSTISIRYPLISYSANIGTIDYEGVNNVSLSINNSVTINQSPNVKCAAIDINDNRNVYVLNGNSLYKVEIHGNNVSHRQVINFKTAGYNIQNVDEALFANGYFGDEQQCAIANVTMNDGTKRTISFVKAKTISPDVAIVKFFDMVDVQQLVSYSHLGSMYYDGGLYSLYGCSYDHGSYAIQFTEFGNVNESMKYSNYALAQNDKAHSIAQLDSTTYAIQTNTGIYKCEILQNIVSLNKTLNTIGSTIRNYVGTLVSYDNDYSQAYYTTLNSNILSSSNLSVWTVLTTAGIWNNSCKIDSFAMLNPYIILAGKNASTNGDAGLYYTYYSYYVENNAEPFTAESAYYAYYDNQSAIDSINNELLAEHIEINHDAKNSDMQLINSYMDTKFQLPSNFMAYNSKLDVQNDYIDRVLTGNTYDDNIIAYSCNSAGNYKWSKLKCNYIAKCWKSGLTELYINLPTTLTYYIPHIEGASQCNGYDEEVRVNGMTLMSNVKDNVTSVRVNIVDSYFTIDTLAENTIKANSLPLRIFKDDEYGEACAGSMYHSFAFPSVAGKFNPNDTMFGYYAFNYYCFGTDAQAIKLTFMNNSPNYDRRYKTITYKSNGGVLQNFAGMTSITQRIYEGDDPTKLYWEIFSKEGSFFVGWSQASNAAEGDSKYSSGTTISYSSMKLMSLTLYACWISYKFDDNDTTLMIANTVPADYTIAEITIDPNASIPNNPALGNKLIVEYGD